MSLIFPPGYVTRPEAARAYNRSQRALERDVTDALARQDATILAHWKLVTKDGTILDPINVTTKQVDQLVAEGMVPTWCVEEAWLEDKYGRKGSSPRRRTEPPIGDQQPPSVASSRSPGRNVTGEGESEIPKTSASLPDDMEFLKERIRILEREKVEDAARNEKREAKLFEQLAVKDRQISAWDEVTQGLTKALATGQLTPTLLTAPRKRPAADTEPEPSTEQVRDASVVETSPARPVSATRQGTNAGAQTRRESKTKKPKRVPQPAAKPKWYEMPTLRRMISRR